MWKLWMSLFVYFQFQAAGFPAQRRSTCDMTSLWNVFHYVTSTQSKGLCFEARHQNSSRSRGGIA